MRFYSGNLAARWLMALGAILFLTSHLHAADAPAPQEVFKQKGLTKVGFLLITGHEAQVHTAVASVRAVKSRVAYETSQRSGLDRSIQSSDDALARLEAGMAAMAAQMQRLKDNPYEYNKLVEPYNTTLAQAKQRIALGEELTKKRDKIENSQPLCDETEIAADELADATLANYAALANDAALTAAIGQFNKSSAQTVKLGPSGACLADVAFLKKCIIEMAADGIPVKFDGDIPVVEAKINGKKRRMLWDSGASTVFLSAESAEELGIQPAASDRIVAAQGADGHTLDCRVVMILEIRVGPFTAQNVVAMIAPKGIPRGDDLLGQAFQRNFICRLDPEAGVLRLTPNPAGESAAVAPARRAGTAPAKADAFSARGLRIVGNALLLEDETEVHKAILNLRGLKTKVASEANARGSMSRAVENAAALYLETEQDLDAANQQIEKVKNNQVEYLKLLDPYNALVKQDNARFAKLMELRKKMGRMDDSQSIYTEAAFSAAGRAEATRVAYDSLQKDAALKSAIDAYNKTAAAVTFAPSAGFLADLRFLVQTLEEIQADGIPIHMVGGVPSVAVTINDRTVEMVWDSGASSVCFSAKTAADLGLHASASDPTVKMTGINGRAVECKVISVAAITVGGYTAHNVECVIDPPGDEHSPDLLGTPFQVNFLCKLDRQAGLLHLTPNDGSAAAIPAASSPAPTPTAPAATPKPAPRPAPAVAPPVIPAPKPAPAVAPPASASPTAPPKPSPRSASVPPQTPAPAPANIPAPKSAPPVVSRPAPAGDLQPGLVGELFQDTQFSSPAKKRIDRQIYFEWQSAGPDPDVHGGKFSIRWTGMLRVPRVAKYVFTASVDDELDLVIDGKTVISQHSNTGKVQGQLGLSAGLHAIRIDYRNTGGEGRLMLQWQQAGGFDQQSLPRDALWHQASAGAGAEAAAPGWRSDLIGGRAGGNPFREDAPENTVLVGFEFSSDNEGGHEVIKSIRPIYRGATSDVPGRQIGDPSGKVVRIVAKPGYAVGLIQARSGDHMDAMSLRFMRLQGGTLSFSDSYDSPWFGGNGGGKVFAGESKPVIGIYGIAEHNCDGVGLITRE